MQTQEIARLLPFTFVFSLKRRGTDERPMARQNASSYPIRTQVGRSLRLSRRNQPRAGIGLHGFQGVSA